MLTIGRAAAVAALVAAFLAAGSALAAPAKSASASLAIVVNADGSCHASSTSTWTGYSVYLVEIQYRADGTTVDGWHDIVYPVSKTGNIGTVVRLAPVAARPGSVWTAHVNFVSRAAVHLAEVDAGAVTAPAGCVYP